MRKQSRLRPVIRYLVTATRALWRALDFSRRLVVNVLFLVLVSFVLALLLDGDELAVRDDTALAVEPAGVLVEQLWGDPNERLIRDLLGQPQRVETLMRDLIDAISRARDDDRVKLLVLDLDRLDGAGLSKLEDLKRVIDSFRDSGKTVVATADFYFQSAYYLASLADEVVLHPMGAVLLTGYGVSDRYYRELLDRWDVEWNVFRVGEYKAAVEPYLRDDMSPEAREARLAWLSDLWSLYRRDVAAARNLEPAALDDYVDRYHLKLAEHGGDAAALALAEGLVDRLATRDELLEWLVEQVGEGDEEGSYRRISLGSYLAAAGRPDRSGDKVVAVVVAKGTILDGHQPPGVIGGESTARLLRQARQDDAVAAVVLRVDSPGGSAFAAEIIRREVEVLRQAGKPVVASMGTVAASGGYWISMSADEIWASPATITGSIGIYAMVPTFQDTLARFGIHADGVGTSPWAGSLRPEMELPEEVRQSLQLLIDQGYRQFVTRAAEGRGMTFEEIDRIARGRVWSGEDALELGLVDQLGGLDEAIAAAAARAGLGDDYGVRFLEKQPSRRARLIQRLLAATQSWLGPGPARAAAGSELLRRLAGLAPEPELLPRLGEPFGLWAYCPCVSEQASGRGTLFRLFGPGPGATAEVNE